MKSYIKPLTTGFLVGLLIGASLGRFLEAPRLTPEKRQQHILKHLSSELHLTPKQKEAVADILKSRRDQMDTLIGDVKPRFEAIRNSAAAEIRKIFEPDQLAKFDKMHEEHLRKERKDNLEQVIH